MNKFDMHFHSNISDWKNSQEEILNSAISLWLDMISLTDHDIISSTKFVDDIRSAWIITNTASEISVREPEKDRSIHLTCYSNNFSDQVFKVLENTRTKKVWMISSQILKLQEKWFKISVEEVYEYFQKKWKKIDSLNKFDISEFIFSDQFNIELITEITGEYFDVETFFLHFLKEWWELNLEYSIKIPEYEPTVEDVGELANLSKAVLSIAHPNFTFEKLWINWFEDSIPKYVELWINAIEINSLASKKWLEAIYDIKKKYNLLITAWSDNHNIWYNDAKHWHFWFLNPLLSDVQKTEILRDYIKFLN